jgi:hypothetical protein
MYPVSSGDTLIHDPKWGELRRVRLRLDALARPHSLSGVRSSLRSDGVENQEERRKAPILIVPLEAGQKYILLQNLK